MLCLCITLRGVTLFVVRDYCDHLYHRAKLPCTEQLVCSTLNLSYQGLRTNATQVEVFCHRSEETGLSGAGAGVPKHIKAAVSHVANFFELRWFSSFFLLTVAYCARTKVFPLWWRLASASTDSRLILNYLIKIHSF